VLFLRVTVSIGVSVMRQRMTDPRPDNPSKARALLARERLVVLSGAAGFMPGHRRFHFTLGAESGTCEILRLFDHAACRGRMRHGRPPT
jgi:hypothetical protein